MRSLFDVRLFSDCITRSMQTLLFSILLLAGACVKPTGNEPTPPPAPGPASPNDTVPVMGGGAVNKVKKNVLINVIPTDVFYPSYTLTYDSSRYLKMINTNYHVFWKNDTISHIINFDTFNGDIRAVSSIFLYNTSKQCYKIITKKRSSWSNGVASVAVTNPFFSDPNDGQYVQYDSLVYSPSGQLTEVWEFFVQTMYKTLALQYTNAQSAAPFLIQYFGVSQTGQPNELWYGLELTTNNIDQPIFNTLWYLPFLAPAGPRSLYVPVTPQTTPGFFYVYMPLIKKCVTYWKFKDYKSGNSEHGNNAAYFYNSDSTVFTGQCNPNDGGWPWFTYGFKKI
jgi:hypothetical protein